MGSDEGRTSTPLTMDIEIATDGESWRHDVRVVMTTQQLDKLAELLDLHVDPDVVALDNDDPQGALFVQLMVATIREVRGTGR